MKTPVTVVVLTYNAGKQFQKCAEMLVKQTANIAKVLIIDSHSTDGTAKLCKSFGFEVDVIDKKDFGHGKTRQYALGKVETEIVVYMTQDALLTDEYAIEKLVDCLKSSDSISAAYGRQLPYPNAGISGSFARLNNYPSNSFVNSLEDRSIKGIKTAFLSDSFAAYKKDVLIKIGGFPENINFGEDMYVAAKMLLSGYKTVYCAGAKVYHSHDYSLKEEFDRCVEIGSFHKREHWLLETFGKAEGEGLKYVVNEAKYLLKSGKWYYLPVAFTHNVVKYLGYKIGKFI